MIPLHHERHFTFRFGEHRLIARFHLDGVAVGVRVSVYHYDATTDTRLGLLTTATVGEGGWVDLAEAIEVRSGQGFIVMPEESNK